CVCNNLIRAGRDTQDATANDPQLRREIQVVRVWPNPPGGTSGRPADDRGRDPGASEWPADVLRLSTERPRVRPAAGAAVRVRSVVGDGGVFPVRPAAGGLPAVRRDGGSGPLVPGEAEAHADVPMVPGA